MATKQAKTEVSVADRLKALYDLQKIDSEIDRIRIVRGELPLEVQDLEDEVAGLETRIEKLTEELSSIEGMIVDKKNAIKDSTELIKKYESQQNNVRNNREYDSLTKEIEYQNLEIQLSEKRIKEYKASVEAKKEIIAEAQQRLTDKKSDLEHKQNELASIVKETEKDETDLIKKSKKAESVIENRLLTAYKRIRSNVRNGLAVVSVDRDACGGCFNKIPPQRQLDIKTSKKVIVCEHCGRILVEGEPEVADIEVQ